MDKISGKNWVKKLITLAVLFSVLGSLFVILLKHPADDPDWGWHLRSGGIILAQKRVPWKDRFSWTMPEYRWADSYWLSEVLFYLGKKYLDFLGLALVFTLFSTATFLVLSWPSMALSFIGAMVATPVIGIRPQTISFILFAFLWLHLRRRPPKPKLYTLYPFLFLLWANLHAGFVLGLFLIWLVWLIEAGRALYKEKFKGQGWWVKEPLFSPSLLKTFFFANLATSAATFINPYGINLWRTIISDASSPLIKQNIDEWLAPNFHTGVGLTLLFYLGLVFWILALSWQKSLPFEVLAICFFTVNTFAAVRNIPFLVAVTTPFLADNLKKLHLPKTIFSLPSWQAMFWPLLFLVLLSTMGRQEWLVLTNFKAWAQDSDYPYQAVNYLRAYPKRGRLFNEYGWGGFLIWQLPEVKTFIDGRMCGWKTKEKNVFADYMDLVKLNQGFEEKIKKWGIDWFLIRSDSPLAAWVSVNPGWKKLYADETATIFITTNNLRDPQD